MVQTRGQKKRLRNAIYKRLGNLTKAAANYRNVNSLMRSTAPLRRARYVLNAAQKIGQVFQRYRARKTARMALNRYLPSDLSRRIVSYMS